MKVFNKHKKLNITLILLTFMVHLFKSSLWTKNQNYLHCLKPSLTPKTLSRRFILLEWLELLGRLD